MSSRIEPSSFELAPARGLRRPAQAGSALAVGYEPLDPAGVLAPNVLGAIAFGSGAALPDDPRCVRVELEPLHGAGLCEVWYGASPVRAGRSGAIRHADDGAHQFAVIEVDEAAHGGIAGAALHAYRQLCEFRRSAGFPHLLRVWNYLDEVNLGEGDDERYKLFCVGRAEAIRSDGIGAYPAATVIGRRGGARTLQVYWLAARQPGVPLENPRQVSAYRYPRQYGPAAPNFSRAMLVPGFGMLISGTASVVGHASHHPHDVAEQLRETLTNLEHVLAQGHAAAPSLPKALDARTLIKMYVREREHGAALTGLLQARLPPATQVLVLEGDVCRSELRVEIEAVQLC